MSDQTEGGALGFFRRAGARRFAGYGLAAAAVVALIVWLGDEAASHVHEIERWLAGLGRGTLLVVCCGFLAAALQYALARHWFAGVATRLVATRPALAGVQASVRQDQLRMQLLLRLTPLSPTLVTYVVSAAGVRFGPFLLACVALVPTWFAHVYFGFAGRHMAVQASSAAGASWVDDGVVVLGLVALIGVVVLVSRAAQRAIAAAEAAPQ